MAYESAKIGGDDYSTYPLDENGKPIPVDMVENGKSFKFVQPAVAKERFVKQFAKNNNMTVQEVKETVFGDQPVGKKKFYITVMAGSYTGIYGSYNKDLLEAGNAYADEIVTIDDNYGNDCEMIHLEAEKLNGQKYEDDSVFEYIGPKYTYLYIQEEGTSQYILYEYDGKGEPRTKKVGYSGIEILEEENGLIESTKNNKNGRIYKKYESSDFFQEIEEIKGYKYIKN